MTNYRRCWSIIGILLLLPLAACEAVPVSLQGNQAHHTATSKTPTVTTAPQISVQGHPDPTAQPTPKPTIRSTKPPTPSPTRNSGGGPGSTSQVQQLAQYVLGLINHDRQVMGLSPYTWSANLARGAHLHNMRMMAYGQLSHQCPGEPDLGTRITGDGLAWREAGENIGWSNYPDPQQGVLSNHQAMMAEQPPDDGHRRNILNTSYTLVGINVLVDSQHRVWLTEDFAQV
jgi:uncharacterized protein YkwD